METQAPYKVITAVQPLITLVPSLDMTLQELRAIEQQYLALAEKDYPDLFLIVSAMGRDYAVRQDTVRVFSTGSTTITRTIRSGLYDTVKEDYANIITMGVTVGIPTHTAYDGAVIRRDTQVAYLTGVAIGAENKFHRTEGTFYRPGRWRDELLAQLHYAHEAINERKEDEEESERVSLAKRLLAGVEL